MNKINTDELEEVTWSSPSGKFGGAGKQVSEALGRDRTSSDVIKCHPFDVEIQRLAPGKISCPYHVHTHQWEFYHVISGRGFARDDDGKKSIGPGDAFLFKPGEPHTIGNDGDEDLILYVVADNPMNEACYYPDSRKWSIYDRIIRADTAESLDYYDGED